jgi:hypothetical protein
MPAITQGIIQVVAPPKTTSNYPGRGGFSVEFTALVVNPIMLSIAQIRGRAIAEAKNYAQYLSTISPRGHTGNLAARWKVITEVDKFIPAQIYCRITNTAPAAYFRIVGRAPGKMPPIRPIKAWAKKKGYSDAVAYAIQKKIGKFGTIRYRTGQNMAGLYPGRNPNTASYNSLYQRDNIVTRFLTRLERRLR